MTTTRSPQTLDQNFSPARNLGSQLLDSGQIGQQFRIQGFYLLTASLVVRITYRKPIYHGDFSECSVRHDTSEADSSWGLNVGSGDWGFECLLLIWSLYKHSDYLSHYLMVMLMMTMVSPGPGQFIFRLKFAQLTDYFAQITSKRILSPFFHVNLNIINNYWSNW